MIKLKIHGGTFNSPLSPNSWTLPSTHNYEKMPLIIGSQKTDLFSINDNEVIVSKNIATLVVSLKVALSAQSTSESRYILFDKLRNGVSVPGGNMTETYCVGSQTTSIIIPITLTDVQAGDHIVVKVYGQYGDKVYAGNAQLCLIGFDIS